jgi:putative ABC transport system permease protein
MALAVAVFLMLGAGNALFGQTEYGFDVLVGVGQGSPLQLVMNTVYHLYASPGNVRYWDYERLNSQERPPRGSSEFDYHRHVRTAIPMAVGDTYKGRPIIGTPPKMFVSVDPLKEQIDSISDAQHKVLLDVQKEAKNLPPALLKRQQDVKSSLDRLKGQMEQVERDSTPFVEIAPDPKWKYGRPAILDLDAAITAADAASAALSAHDSSKAIAQQRAVETSLDTVRTAVGFESGPLEYKPDEHYEIAEGRVFHAWKLEAVIGSEVAEKTGLKIGSVFQATHGNPGPKEIPDIHAEKWQVVGIMKKTHTAGDRCLYIPLVSFYCIAEHKKGLIAQADVQEGRAAKPTQPDDEGPPDYKLVAGNTLDPSLPATPDYIALDLPKDQWEVSAILIASRGGVTGDDLMYFIKNGGMQSNLQAVNPARIMQEFFDTFFQGTSTVLLVIALLVSIVAAVGILVSIYNSVSARMREIAILRALGATRVTILTLICLEAGLIGLFGGILGLIGGHVLGGIASSALNARLGTGFNWIAVGAGELVYLGIVVLIAFLAGFVPAVKAYRTPVATNLVAV